MVSSGSGVIESTGFAFSLGRRIAVKLLERSLQERLKVLVEHEVRAAVLEHLGSRRTESPAMVQIVVGEVYNVVEQVDGVVRAGNDLHIEEGARLIEPLPVDDPRLDALVRKAQLRLNAMVAKPADEPAETPPMFPPAEQPEGKGKPAPAMDADQRLLPEAADRYRDRLERLAREDLAS